MSGKKNSDSITLPQALIYLLPASVSFGLFVLAFAYGYEISKLPSGRFQGGHGFAMNAPVMLYGFAGFAFFLIGSLLFVASLYGRFKTIYQLPNAITLLFLLPGFYVSLVIIYRFVRIALSI